MKKLLAVLLVLALCIGTAFAEEAAARKIVEGHLSYAAVSAEELHEFLITALNNNSYVWTNYFIGLPEYSQDRKDEPDITMEFESMADIVMALDAGKIDDMELPKPVGEYFLRQGSNADKYIPYIISVISNGIKYYLSMGFSKGSKWFEPFNAAIKAMNEDDTLLLLKAKYIDYAKDDLKPITFEKYPDAETVKIAVTGDMPPIDYIASDGTPAGFNTALLAEIGKRLKVNIELLSIHAGARAAALSSGRADGVFWFWYNNSIDGSLDTPEGAALTEPYYTFDTWMYIGKKISK